MKRIYNICLRIGLRFGIQVFLATLAAWMISLKTGGEPVAIIVGWLAFFIALECLMAAFRKFEV